MCSPLLRAWDTMALAGFAAVAQPRDDLVEWDYGVYEGRTTEEIRTEAPDWSVWTHPIYGGESLNDVGERVDRIIAEVRGTGGTTAIFAHAHLLRILTARWIGLAPLDGRSFRLETATVSVLGWERENPVIIQWNEERHLHSLDR
jgi:probable phosphoglycerate mutase